jgi:hypothetical protein
LIIFEFIYRYQLVDTYYAELAEYNSEADLGNSVKKKVILVMGDSFTAGPDTYCARLKSSFKDYTVINSGIPGTGIIQTVITARRRFQRYSPEILIYQLYVGNDLFDITYPVNIRRISVVRNLYWTLSQRFRSVGLLNYKLGQLAASRVQPSEISRNDRYAAPPSGNDDYLQKDDEFSVERYNSREKTYLQAEPYLLENHILVKRNRAQDFAVLQDKILDLLSCHKAMGGRRAYLLVIPHCCQTSPVYLDHMKRLGAEFSDDRSIFANDYPFVALLSEFVKERGLSNITILNPIGLFRDEEASGRHVYFQNDPHLNSYGQELPGEWVYRQIRHSGEK